MSNLGVQTNLLAINSHRNLKMVGGKLSTASARLSSGYRINSAADDASGMAISEKMRAQIRGLDMASKNAQDGISMIQVAEGGLQEVDGMIHRIRELTVQAANDTNDYVSADRKKLQDEIDQLTASIDQMAWSAEFNKKKLLDGSLTDPPTRGSLLADLSVKIQLALGANGASAFNVATGTAPASSFVGLSTLVAFLASNNLGTQGSLGIMSNNANNQYAFSSSTSLTYNVTLSQGGTTNEFSRSVSAPGLKDSAGNIVPLAEVAPSNVSSADAVSEYIGAIDSYVGLLQDAKKSNAPGVDDVLTNLLQNRKAAIDIYAGLELVAAEIRSANAMSKVEGAGLYFQTGANSEQGINAGVGKVTSDILGIGRGNGVSTIKVDKPNSYEISAQIDVVDNSLQYVTSQRAKLGAVQNRMEYAKVSVEVSSENLAASESRIRDADMAKEMMNFTSANVLQQAGVSMLTQANQMPQSVLSLLK